MASSTDRAPCGLASLGDSAVVRADRDVSVSSLCRARDARPELASPSSERDRLRFVPGHGQKCEQWRLAG